MYECVKLSFLLSGYLEVMTPSEIEELKNNNNIFKAKRKLKYLFDDSDVIERYHCMYVCYIDCMYMHTYILT